MRLPNKHWILLSILILLLAACAAPAAVPSTSATEEDHHEDEGITHIAELTPLTLSAPLTIVTTTSIIGDVARNVAGDAAAVTTLLPAGSDPHAYVPTPQDLVTLSNADLLLINDAGLEEALLPTLAAIEGPVVVSVNEGVALLEGGEEAHAEEEGHDHEFDPHTWQDVANVRYWTQNIGAALSALDPDNASVYAENTSAYDAQLAALEQEVSDLLAPIPDEARKLVTDHDDLGYFAHAHNFQVIGALIPSASALASVSAQEMAALQKQIQDEGVRAIFIGNTVNPDLANQLAQDTGVDVVPLYTDALGDADSPAPTYVEMMRYNAQAIANALTE